MDYAEQVRRVHARLICAVVQACHNAELRPPVEQLLGEARAQGWTGLVPVIRKILAGSRDAALLKVLDEEDTVIATSILQGLRDPATLPDPEADPEPQHAAPGLAHLIAQARRGDGLALEMLGNMGEQMQTVGGDMARLAATLRPLINGERDGDQLARGMGAGGRSLLRSILEELGKLETH